MFFIVNLNETRAIIGSKSGKGGKLMDEKWQQLKEWIQESQYIVFFGGAGVSTESKIPDFRSEDGLYRQKYKYPPETIISHSFYMKNTEEFYRFYKDRMIYKEAVPNDAHRALAKLEQEGKVKAVITQNIDGLHQKAGSKKVIELHGSVLRNICQKCGRMYGMEEFMELCSPVPHCSGCGGVVKPDVVLYEEMLDRNTIEDAIDEISRADMLIIGGTSLVVYPAAGYVDYFQGDSLVMINRDETPRDSRCSLVFRESVGKVLEAGVAALKE